MLGSEWKKGSPVGAAPSCSKSIGTFRAIGAYEVIFFTELDDHNREAEINRAANGEHVYDGFIRNRGKDQAKLALGSILERMNNGEELQAIEIEKELQPYTA